MQPSEVGEETHAQELHAEFKVLVGTREDEEASWVVEASRDSQELLSTEEKLSAMTIVQKSHFFCRA